MWLADELISSCHVLQYNNPDSDWPAKDECDTYVQKVPDPRNLSTIYLSPENKGFEWVVYINSKRWILLHLILKMFFYSFPFTITRVKALLTEAQNLQQEDEHPLPWYPPVCVPLMEIPEGQKKTYDHIKSVTYEERTRIPLKLNDPSMFPVRLPFIVPQSYL